MQNFQSQLNGDRVREIITEECNRINRLLIEKNISYGNSALEPINIFSHADAEDQINVRIDDKLNRIKKGSEFGTEDTELDLVGYLILKRVLRRVEDEAKVDVPAYDDGLPHCERLSKQERDIILGGATGSQSCCSRQTKGFSG